MNETGVGNAAQARDAAFAPHVQRQPLVSPLLCFTDPRQEEQFWRDQVGQHLHLMSYWAPNSDPALGSMLLALHLTLLLRLALLGGLEQWPLPLLGAYLAWFQLRTANRWPLGWVQVRLLLLPASQVLLAAAVAVSSADMAAGAAQDSSSGGGGGVAHCSSLLQQLGKICLKLVGGMCQAGGRGLEAGRIVLQYTGGGLQAAQLCAAVQHAMGLAWRRASSVLSAGGAGSSLKLLWSSGSLGTFASECTSFWVLLFSWVPHLAQQPLAVTAGVQLAAAGFNIAACRSTCTAMLHNRPSLQQQYAIAAQALQELTVVAPLPVPAGLPRLRGTPAVATVASAEAAASAAGAMLIGSTSNRAAGDVCNAGSQTFLECTKPAVAGAAGPAATPAGTAGVDPAALAACCAVRAFAWLLCCCVFSLRLLYMRELRGRHAWARQRCRWAAPLAQELRWRFVPGWTSLAETLFASCLMWHLSSLLFLSQG